MINFLNSILVKLGYSIYSKNYIKSHTTDSLTYTHNLNQYDIASIRGNLGMGLKEKLLNENKTKWLDIGCGGNLEEDFYYLDTFPEGIIKKKDRYFRCDIINMSENDFLKIGTFDFIRLQHVFEHFTPENGIRVLDNCAKC